MGTKGCDMFVEARHRVAGHAGSLHNEDGSIFAKPTSQQEIDFYTWRQAAERDSGGEHELGSQLQDWMPQFIGVLEPGLSQELLDASAQAGSAAVVDPELKEQAVRQDELAGSSKGKNKYILLENLLQGYVCPSVMDIKLGSVLYDETADDAKRARMIKVSSETTSGSLDFRICGMKIWYPRGGETGNVEQTVGCKRDPADDGYLVFDKSFGRSLQAADVVDGFRLFFETNLLPEEIQQEILKNFHARLQMLYNCLLDEKIRVVSGSLLFIFENELGKWQDEGVEHDLIYPRGLTADDAEDTEEDTDLDDDLDDTIPKLSSLNFIDFAHAKRASSPDERLITGVENIIVQLEKLIRE